MRITILTGPFMCLPPYSIGAVEKLWASLGQSWKDKGHQVLFISKRPEIQEINDTDNIYVKGYGRTGSFIKDFVLDFIYSFRALRKMPKTDIVILNSQWSPILIRLFKRKSKIVIYSVERFPKNQLGKYDRYGKVDLFRCCSSAVYNEAVRQSPEIKSKAITIPNFIDTDVFKGKVKEPSEQFTVVYAGRINKEKGLDILVKACEMLYAEGIGVSLMLIGAFDKEKGGSGMEYKKELDNLAKHIKINWVDAIYDPKELSNVLKNVRGGILLPVSG